jgi:DivIVA domain-containing protein
MTASDPPTFTPESIRTAVFKHGLRGYRREDVDRFLRDLADHEQAQRAERAELESDRARLQTRVAELESHDAEAARAVAGRAMLTAQQSADELIERTKGLCDALVETARSEAEAIAARTEAKQREAEVGLTRQREREQELASAYTVLLHAACEEAGVEVPSGERRAGLLAG